MARTLHLIDLKPESESFEQAVLEGLSRSPKSIPPKFLYDQRGSELFDRICDLREYYVTRTETMILETHAGEMARELGERPVIFEFGSGASRKTRILLRHLMNPAAYLPIDISRDYLVSSSRDLQREFPDLPILPVCADFTRELALDDNALPRGSCRRAGFFPGSTIGNFHRDEARAFLARTARFLGSGGRLLLGVDLLKDRSILEPAYDDSEGVTAAFNLNLLLRMRRELRATVDPSGFRHRALFNEIEGRIEMHLESLRDQSFTVGNATIEFRQGETLHTECSYKYAASQFEAMAGRAGYRMIRRWTDPDRLFAVYLLEVEPFLDARQAA